MTVSEAKESSEGGSFTSHRDELGKSVRSEELKAEKGNDIDQLSEQVSSISIDESKPASPVEDEIEKKLGKLSISSVLPITSGDDDVTNEYSNEKTEVTDEGKGKSLQLNITERCDGDKENEQGIKGEKKISDKDTVLELNLIDNDDGVCKDGKDKEEEEDADVAKRDGELCPRSPMRPDHGNVRSEPYQVTSRNLHHNSGGFYCVSEQTTNYNPNSQNNWPINLNIPSEFLVGTGFASPPPYPFPSADSPAEYTDEGVYDISSPEVCNPNRYDDTLIQDLDEGPSEEDLAKLVFELLDKQDIDLNKLAQASSDLGFLNNDPSYSPIPVSVTEFDQIPSVSSGYVSSDSPRSTNSTPSPSSSLKGSQEKLNVGFYEPPCEQMGSFGVGCYPPFSIQASPSYADTDPYCNSVQDDQQMPAFIFKALEDDSLSSPGQFNVPVPKVFPVSEAKRLEPNPTFSLGSATERLIKKLDKTKKSKTWAHISTIQNHDLAKGDSDGDTQLMILLLQEPLRGSSKLETIYAIVERLKRIPNALTAVNRQGQSALYLAALHCSDLDADLITRYIAETLLSIDASVDTSFDGGDSLLHCLCRHGGKHFSVLRELLSLSNKTQCFQLDKFNAQGMTALHVAASSHQGSQHDCTKMVRLLINAGANATLLTEDKARCSALHLAIQGSCDPTLVEALLTSPQVAATCEDAFYRRDTVLHLIAQRNDLPLAQQSRVFKALIERKARRDARDSKGKLPLELVAPERREEIKLVIQQRR